MSSICRVAAKDCLPKQADCRGGKVNPAALFFRRVLDLRPEHCVQGHGRQLRDVTFTLANMRKNYVRQTGVVFVDDGAVASPDSEDTPGIVTRRVSGSLVAFLNRRCPPMASP
jgi:hypothetical protein